MKEIEDFEMKMLGTPYISNDTSIEEAIKEDVKENRAWYLEKFQIKEVKLGYISRESKFRKKYGVVY